MKTLIIIIHPNLKDSIINKRWIEELKKYPQDYVLHDIHQWLDEVLTHGWAYGRSSGYKLAGKKIALAITAGIDKEDYRTEGRYKYTLEQLTAPFEITCRTPCYNRSNREKFA
jgi:putative NADPH-quinone reductase